MGKQQSEQVLWEGRPIWQSLVLPFAACGVLVVTGIALLALPDLIPFATGTRIVPGLVLIGAGLLLGIIAYRYSGPGQLRYILTPHELRIDIRGRSARRLVRGELKLIRRRLHDQISWARTLGFNGNESGRRQWGREAFGGLKDPDAVFARLVHWTCGDEREAEAGAERYLADPGMGRRQIEEPRWGLTFTVPADWPVESRRWVRRALTLLGWKSPIGLIGRSRLLPLAGPESAWDQLRVRASDRVGLSIELSERVSDEDRNRAEARWATLGPLESRSEVVPIAGFRGVIAEQAAGPLTPPDHAVCAGREWSVDGYEDEGFGFVSTGGRRLLLWATDGEVALQIRAWMPSDTSASATALREMLASIQRTGSGVPQQSLPDH